MNYPRTRARRRRAIVAGLTLAVTLGLVATATAAPAGAASKSLTVGSKNFSGAQALSQAYGQALQAKGYDISFKDNIGPTEIVYKALQNGDLDGYADYQGTLLEYLGGNATGNTNTTYAALLAK